MELICINSSYGEDYLRVFNKYGISYPKEGEIVTLVRVDKYPRLKRIGLIVSPYNNQFISGEIMGVKGDVEVSFSKDRFTTLLGVSITDEMIKEFKDEQKGILEPIKIKKDEDSLLQR